MRGGRERPWPQLDNADDRVDDDDDLKSVLRGPEGDDGDEKHAEDEVEEEMFVRTRSRSRRPGG